MKVTRHNLKRLNFKLGASGSEHNAALPSLQSSKFEVQSSRFDSEHGVALVITVIMLTVITFMAVTFLAVSRRDRGAVTVTTDQTVARFAADAALEQAKTEVLAPILGGSNVFGFDLCVATNFIARGGYDAAQLFGVPNPTNVNYHYPNGNPLIGNDALQNLANLLYNPPPPVFVLNRLTGSNEFRFYLDLNRNGRYDPSGWWGVTNELDQPVFTTDPGGNSVLASNFFVGDPEWIGILERPDRPHSATNLFTSRYTYLVVPSGKTLDVNFIHNHAKPGIFQPTVDGFYRNQGVGSWEINLAAFLADLNTNIWHSHPVFATYQYQTDPIFPSTGVAFEDALALLRYRVAGNHNASLWSVATLFGGRGVSAFSLDTVDGYAAGPLITDYWGWRVAPDADAARVNTPWWGAPNTNHYFSTQDFFDKNKTRIAPFAGVNDFTDRLLLAANYSPSSYDRYTYYRMLGQLGTDSAPETDAMNLNYDNLTTRNLVTGSISATNFYPWEALAFFTNAAHRLLQRFSSDWLGRDAASFVNTFGTNQVIGVTNIPVLVNGRFAYSPALHRQLQLAANVWDAMTNRLYPNAATYPYLPTVFRPIVRRQGNDVFVVDYVTVDATTGSTDPRFNLPLDLNDPADLAQVPPVGAPPALNDVNVYGVPWVIGAKKGLPNFNEFTMQTVLETTRKLQITRSLAAARNDVRPQDDPSSRTNMLFEIGISNALGLELWNSYATDFARPVDVMVSMELKMTLTNSYGYRTNLPAAWIAPVLTNIPANAWKANVFMIPLATNVQFIPAAAYRFPPLAAGFTTNQASAWDQSQAFPQTDWGLAVTNQVRCIIRDQLSGRVIDYVQLGNLTATRDLSAEIRDPDNAIGYNGLWSTNRLGQLPQGVLNQILVSLGNYGSVSVNQTEWNNNSLRPYSASVQKDIDLFAALFHLGVPYALGLRNSNPVVQVPFTPTKKFAQRLIWAANDPLVHYLAGDLADSTNSVNRIRPPTGVVPNLQAMGIGRLNDRYRPWGGNPVQTSEGSDVTSDPNAYNLAIKDPAVRSSDYWLFPTNKFPSLGWLGRVHRGTPWQTVYLKSPGVDDNLWRTWSGNPNGADAKFTQPAGDRALFDLFTTAFNENAARGQLPVNQSGLAAWSAVFSGMIALTNSLLDAEVSNLALNRPVPPPTNSWLVIQPAGPDTNTPLWRIVHGINRTRANTNVHPRAVFERVGDLLSVPELSTNSPFLNLATDTQRRHGVNDAMVEWLPQQVLSLVRGGEPKFVVYAYGQTLRPAPRSRLTGGPFIGMCTNYQITAEVATRAVVRIEGAPNNTRAVVESFNVLPPD